MTSGHEFSGEKCRTFKSERKFQNSVTLLGKNPRKSKWKCVKWGVMTTIFSPSESVRRFLYRKDWCVVVVGDSNKPKVSLFTTLKLELPSFETEHVTSCLKNKSHIYLVNRKLKMYIFKLNIQGLVKN